MRLYTFTHFFLNTMSQGIQPAHVVSELFVTYNKQSLESVQRDILNDWATNHKTMICLNGGDSASMSTIASTIVTRFGPGLKLPCAMFYEDDQTLRGLLTSVGIVVPESIYSKAANYLPEYDDNKTAEYDLIRLLKSKPLAR